MAAAAHSRIELPKAQASVATVPHSSNAAKYKK